jgi:hypothetical protein
MSQQLSRIVLVAFWILASAGPLAASDIELDFGEDEVRIEISKEMARGIVEGLIGSELSCDGEVDPPFRALLEELDREGSRARATYRDGDTTIDARRRGGSVTMKIRGSGKSRINLTIPWQLARCMLGGSTTVDRSITSAVKVKIVDEKGKKYSFRLQ